MFIFHTIRNSEKQEENCWEKFHSGVYFLKKSSSKKNQWQKRANKINSISPNQMLPIPSKNNTYIATFRLKIG